MTLEAFAWSEDRDRLLQRLIPGQEEELLYRVLDFQHRRKLDAADTAIAAFARRFGKPPLVHELRLRQALLRGDLDHVRQAFDLVFDHATPTRAGHTRTPTTLAPSEYATERLHQLARRRADLSGFTPAGLQQLARTRLEPHERRALLDALEDPTTPHLVALILGDLDAPEPLSPRSFADLPIQAHLTLDHLQQLAFRKPSLRKDEAFVLAWLRRLRPADDLDLDDPAVREPYLRRLWDVAQDLEPVFSPLRALILRHWLALDLRQGRCDTARLLDYLQIPQRAAFVDPALLKRAPHVVSDDGPWPDVTGLGHVHDPDALVERLLEHALADADSVRPFDAFVRDAFVRRCFARAKLYRGEVDDAHMDVLRDAGEIERLRDEVVLELAPTNPRHLGSEEDVALELDVKAVDALTVKIFELNALNHWLDTHTDVGVHVDLDGLAPSHERSLPCDAGPWRKQRLRVDLPELDHPGVYVVEFVGAGRACRALLRKGDLHVLDRINEAGHALTVIDEAGRPRPDATVLLDGRVFSADDGGEVRIPFTRSPGPKTALLCLGGLAVAREFRHHAEHYQLHAALVLDREDVRAGEPLTLRIRARLDVHGVRVPLDLLDDVRLSVEATDRHGTPVTREFEGLTLDDRTDAEVTLRALEGPHTLSARLSGVVRPRSDDPPQALESRRTWSLNQSLLTARVGQFFLSRARDGVTLWLLGRSGEPLADQPVRVRLQHRTIHQETHHDLCTDSGGRVELGPLDGVTRVVATSDVANEGWWPLQHDVPDPPSSWTIRTGHAGRLPHDLGWGAPRVIERRADAPVADVTEHAQLDDGCLTVDLPPGTYTVSFADVEAEIALRVLPGDPGDDWPGDDWPLDHWAVSPDAAHALSPTDPLRITAVEETATALRVRLRGGDAETLRLHALGAQFESEDGPLQAWSLRSSEPPSVWLRRRLCAYTSGRDLGDEVRYVLDRRDAERFPGVMLPTPGSLLNPWARQDTQTVAGRVRGGDDYEERGFGGAAKLASKLSSSRDSGRLAQVGASPCLEFLEAPAGSAFGLRPDADGWVEVPLTSLAGASTVTLVALDAETQAARRWRRPEPRLRRRDLRLRGGLEPRGTFVERQGVSALQRGDRLEVVLLGGAQVNLVRTWAQAFDLLRRVVTDEQLEAFRVLGRWDRLSREEKLQRYDQLACHELHLFVKRRDPELWQEVLAPYLANKRRQTVFDRILLEADVEEALTPWRWAQLDALQKGLLAQVFPERRAAIVAEGEAVCAAQAARARDTRWFLAGLDGDGLSEDVPAAKSIVFGEDLSALDDELDRTRGSFEQLSSEAPREEKERKKKRAKRKRDRKAREETFEQYREPDTTKEWAERQYYRRQPATPDPGLIPWRRFWVDAAAHAGDGPFVSSWLGEASGNLNEALAALAISDLPFEAPEHPIEQAGGTWSVRAGGPALVFHREAREAPLEPGALLVGQRLLRYEDRDAEDPKPPRELVRQQAYTARVVLTNPTGVTVEGRLLLQIPRGALPLCGGEVTFSQSVRLGPYEATRVDHSFYFPEPGTFWAFGPQVSVGDALVAAVEPQELEVVESPQHADTESWDHVAERGEPADVLRYLAERPLVGIDLSKIGWRLRDRDLWAQVVQTLRARLVYDRTVWSYALHHGDLDLAAEWVASQHERLRTVGALEGDWIRLDPEERGWYEHLEYAPLVLERAHPLRNHHEILNDRFAAQYRRFLELLARKPTPSVADRMALTGYLLAQGRTADALRWFDTLAREDTHERLQYDYLAAYVALAREDLEGAEAAARPHAAHPILRWRERFAAVLEHVAEARGASERGRGSDDGEPARGLAPSLELEVRDGVARVRGRGIASARLSLYRVDLELLFSRRPFLGETQSVAYVQPNHTQALDLTPGEVEVALPADLARANAIVEVTGGGLRRSTPRYAHAMHVEVTEALGELQVRRAEDDAPASKVYVKVYAKRGGDVRFHKDGYTDLRGRFDYASVSATPLLGIDRFAILLVSDDLGSLARTASAP